MPGETLICSIACQSVLKMARARAHNTKDTQRNHHHILQSTPSTKTEGNVPSCNGYLKASTINIHWNEQSCTRAAKHNLRIYWLGARFYWRSLKLTRIVNHRNGIYLELASPPLHGAEFSSIPHALWQLVSESPSVLCITKTHGDIMGPGRRTCVISVRVLWAKEKISWAEVKQTVDVEGQDGE